MFKVGDKVRLIYNFCKQGPFVGDTGTITKVGDFASAVLCGSNIPIHTYRDQRNWHLYIRNEDLKLVEGDPVEKLNELKEKTMQVPFTITGNMISVFLDGKSHFVNSNDKAYAELKEHLKGQHDPEVIRDLVDKKAYVTKVTEGWVTVSDNEVFYKGEVVHSALTQKLLTLLDEGFDIRPWAKFMDNLMQNPSYKSREALFNFLEKWSAPITEDGHFLAWKNVRHDFKDIHSGTMDNSPGRVVTMDRTQVDDDSDRTCSSGLHAAATSYLQHFYVSGSKTVVVKINPRDVVAVPKDYDSAKMRTCRYEVLREVEQEERDFIERQQVTSDDGFSIVEMYEEEMSGSPWEDTSNSYDDDYYDSYDDYV
jgi:hypothetical protein